MNISLKRAKSLALKFRRQKILVVGDLMLDRYIYGSVSRLSPEAPVPIVLVRDEKNMPGGAANVARNVKALGGRASIFGLIGSDQAGRELLEVMRSDGVSSAYVTSFNKTRTTVKMRVIGERQQVVRVDWDNKLSIKGPLLAKLCAGAARAAAQCTGIIMADYAKGLICPEIVSSILKAAKQRKVPVAIDPKENRDLPMDGIALATPNRKEAFSLAGIPETEPAHNPLDDRILLRVGEILARQWNPSLLVITLGAQGMLVIPRAHKPFHVATVAREVFDVSGAGDTVIGTMLLALSAGATDTEAAELANCAAGVVVGKIGTATCSVREILELIGNLR
jgi:D-beta-D-heptose 7-phosphate kinase/D-beta-D-heptose 1-phosphate adenosyltransferase